MADTITMDRDLARKLWHELDSLMDRYDYPTSSGNDVYACTFCEGFRYADSGRQTQHSPECLGVKLMASLTNTFNGRPEPVPSPQEDLGGPDSPLYGVLDPATPSPPEEKP